MALNSSAGDAAYDGGWFALLHDNANGFCQLRAFGGGRKVEQHRAAKAADRAEKSYGSVIVLSKGAACICLKNG